MKWIVNNYVLIFIGISWSSIILSKSNAFLSIPKYFNNNLQPSFVSTITKKETSSLCADLSDSSNDNNDKSNFKTYGETLETDDNLLDVQGAMNDFFESNQDWFPVFQSMAQSSSVPAMNILKSHNDQYTTFWEDFPEDELPWTKLEAIPTKDSDRDVLASVLDAMHKGLVEIPVTENKKEDQNDLHFIEEGRRMLVVSRFHVLQDVKAGDDDSYNSLFSTCWSELMLLRQEDQNDTGSLIVVPDYELSDLNKFVQDNIQRPLQWLGMDDSFEVVSMERGSPAIRLIHKLSGIPNVKPEKPVKFGDLLREASAEAAALEAAENKPGIESNINTSKQINVIDGLDDKKTSRKKRGRGGNDGNKGFGR